MKEYEIREGDIVEIDYINEFTKEHINEGKALVMWKGNNRQPLVHKLSTKNTVWTCYEYIAKVVGHVDIERYMEDAIALEREPCDDCISRQAVLEIAKSSKSNWIDNSVLFKRVNELPPVMPQPKTAHWIHFANSDDCSVCGWSTGKYISPSNFCPNCGARMVEPQESEDV